MKIEVRNHTITALNNLKGLWLLCGDNIIVIRDFQYIQETEELSETKKKHYFNRKSEVKEPKRKNYITSIKIEGYHQDLKFIGTYNEEYCTRLIEQHDSSGYTLDLIQYRKAWTELKEQIDAFTEKEIEKAASEPAENNS
jgi:hypothetical protein